MHEVTGIGNHLLVKVCLPLLSLHLSTFIPSSQTRLIPKALLFIFLLGLAHSEEKEIRYQNQLEQKLCAECPKGYAMHEVIAKASTDVVDRQWRWKCEKVGDPILMW